MTVGPGRSSANCRGGVGVKSNLILNLRFETVFCFFKLITEDWFLDVMWDFDFLYWDFEYDNMDLSFGGINSGSPSREQGGCWGCSRTRCRLRSHTWGWLCKALNYWDVSLENISFHLVLEFVSSFSSRSYPPARKCTDSVSYTHLTLPTIYSV